MEKRLLIAIVLSFVILFVYQAVFVKKEPPPDQAPQTVGEKTRMPEQKSIPEEQPPPEEKPADVTFEATEATQERDVVVDTSLFRAVWSNKGAQLKSWKLREHLDENDEPLELISNRSADINRYPFRLSTDDPDFDSMINSALYTASKRNLSLSDGQTGDIRFAYAQDDGTKVEKIFTFRDGKYTVDVQITVWKNGQRVEPRLIWGPGLGNLSPSEQKNRIGIQSGVSVSAAGRVDHHDERKYKPERSAYNFVNWAAYVDQYFAAMFFTDPQRSSALFLKESIEDIPYFFLSVSLPQKAYIGPKEFDRLVELGNGAKGVIRFGLFGFISEILFRAMKAVHNTIPNWGLCIIIITLVVKIIFFPLTYSSTRSMAKMQELQPKIKALRSKYKKAKQDINQRRKMNEETMKLYKEHGVNPAGGCLPILIQLPIFWGFFRLLMVSIEFRHSPFIFWIKDLSVKDPIYVTPILMGITQYISQKMTPTSADPTQQKMMLIMPVIMTIFFMNFSSGLVLYWLTNNVLQIAQQYIMNRIQKKKKQKSQTHGKRRK
ncbi:MAG: membrane protein insertase YidC [Candidatus Aminicenantes bacterium]|jgi:YidC/Oxa1 family membrane protein insertase